MASGAEHLPEGREHDVIVFGAGVVGSAMAYRLGQQGRRVLLIERDLSYPDRIVGELMQPGGVAALQKLGLASAIEGIDAVRCDGYEILFHDKTAHIPYPVDEKTGKHATGASFVHGRFVMNLRKAAAECKNVTILEATVNNFVRNPYTQQVLGVACTPKGAKSQLHHFAKLTIVCDGCFSRFRRELVQKKARVRSNFVGIVLKNAELPFPHHGHVILSNIAPILVYQISSEETRMLVDVAGEKLPSQSSGELHRYLEDKVYHVLPDSLKPSFREALANERLRSMPNNWLPSSTNTHPGVILIGDAMNMRHPLTGGGMTVGLNDVVLVSELLSPEKVNDLGDTRAVLTRMALFHWKRKNLSSVVNILAQALYALFAADDSRLLVLQRGCFNYLSLGGSFQSGPAGLLSGVRRQPWLLFYHFFAVAFYSAWLMVADSKNGLLGYVTAILASVAVMWKACMVIFPYIFSELTF